ncbi:hypothetical protein GH733_007940, partial [Mirounga leonina]
MKFLKRKRCRPVFPTMVAGLYQNTPECRDWDLTGELQLAQRKGCTKIVPKQVRVGITIENAVPVLKGRMRRHKGDCQRDMSPTVFVLLLERLLRTDPVPEEGEDVAATISATETLSEEEQEELRRELAKVEEEIQTLSQVLAAKEKHLAEIKRKLGINSLQELKQNIAKGWQDVTATSAYKKTSETLSQAGQKASAAFSSVGSVITKKLEDV